MIIRNEIAESKNADLNLQVCCSFMMMLFQGGLAHDHDMSSYDFRFGNGHHMILIMYCG